jgi:hypothetical protein
MNRLALFVKGELRSRAGSFRGKSLLHGVRWNWRIEFSVARLSAYV